MSPLDRRRFLIGAAGTAGLVALAGCTDGGDGSGGGDAGDGSAAAGDPDEEADTVLAVPGSAGLVDEDVWQGRVDEYLAVATAELDPSNVTSINAHLIRARRDDDFAWDPAQVTVDALADVLAKIDAWEDTRDFDLMYMLWTLALGRGDTPTTVIDEEVLSTLEQRFVDNRYRYDDPNPDGRTDELWYWSENHRLITLTDEHLAGQMLPDVTFTVTGMTGAEHRDRAKPEILEWVRERGRLGFFEWHSNVYMLKNITPLTNLVELADDPEVVAAAGACLDVCLADLATHLHAGCYVAPRGRTYKKDKMSGLDEATFGTAKLVFADTDEEYPSPADNGATYLSAAARYRPPQALIDIATSDETSVVRERHGVFVDASAPVADAPEAPHGVSFSEPANLAFWWSLGAIGMWQTVDISIAAMDSHDLWDVPLLVPVTALADINGRDPERIKAWVQERHAAVNFGFLSEANTYAWRSPEISMASVLDHRFGEMRDQAHAWQAQIDADALVFTNHPVTDVDTSTDWDDDGRPGYWTGEASMPRSAQHERTSMHIYQPAWDEGTDDVLWAAFGYQPFTHAYVPQDAFDTVTQVGHWTIASKGDGHIALWSWRAPTWRVYDPEVHATRGMVQPFDLVAEGGPDNVWICEVGTAADDGDHSAFVAAVTGSEPSVERTDEGFTVVWTSPSSGEVTFGSTGPFTVAGEEVALGDFPRHQSPWGAVPHLDPVLDLSIDGSRAVIDLDSFTRDLS